MNARKSTIILIVVAILCVVTMLIVTVSNVNGLSAAVQRRTYSYLRDVSKQSAQVIEERFTGLTNSLQIIGNSLAFTTVVPDGEFMNTKIGITEFDALTYVRPNGVAVTVDRLGNVSTTYDVFDEFADSPLLQESMRGETTAGFYETYIAFMEPIMKGDVVQGIMIGVRSRDSLERLLVNDAFGGIGVTFIVDEDGNVLAQPMDQEEHEALLALVQEAMDDFGKQIDAALEAGKDIESLDVSLQEGNGKELLLDYQPLSMFDWAVVTMVDENFLAEEVNMYVMRTITVLFVLMSVFMLMFIIMIVMQWRYQKRLESVAFIDPLTGGMSFIRFRVLAEPLVQKGDSGDYALVNLNIKRFKLINRLGGSIEGDKLLRTVYKLLESEMTQPDEMVAHGTADNFMMLVQNEGETELRERLEGIARKLETVESVLPVCVSQGVYAMTDPNIDMIVFLDRANLARASEADQYHSTCVFYDDDFVKQQEDRLRMLSMIEQGLEEHQFTVFLQPKVSPATLELMGAEALVRWIHPTRGMIGPNLFIPLCEQNGLICALDLYVFEMVCAQIQKWAEKGWIPKPISVNVSGQHLKDISFVKHYREIADKYNVDPSMIELELTESIMFSDSEIMEARSIIDSIHEYGFRCSMDDFGSGYSALGVLQDLPMDCIKLDRSFFIDCIGNPRAQIVIDMIIKLAQKLDIVTVAEGIETKPQVEMLKAMGCDMIQGFYFSPPIPMDAFAEMIFVKHHIFYRKGETFGTAPENE